MIHELRTYTLLPGTQGKYLELNRDIGRKDRKSTRLNSSHRL